MKREYRRVIKFKIGKHIPCCAFFYSCLIFFSSSFFFIYSFLSKPRAMHNEEVCDEGWSRGGVKSENEMNDFEGMLPNIRFKLTSYFLQGFLVCCAEKKVIKLQKMLNFLLLASIFHTLKKIFWSFFYTFLSLAVKLRECLIMNFIGILFPHNAHNKEYTILSLWMFIEILSIL